MIFPGLTLEDWLKRHPGLSVLETHCLACNGVIQTTRPFITKDYLGLIAFNCPVCSVPHKTLTGIPYSASELSVWANTSTLV